MFDVVGLGENSLDEVCRVPELPRPGSAAAKLRIISRSACAGGQVATTMAACAALGLRAKYVGTFGNDAAGEDVRAELEARGVDTSDSLVRAAPSRRALILVDPGGERVVLWQRDERLTLAPEEVQRAWFERACALHVDAVDPLASGAAARLARSMGCQVTSDIEEVTDGIDALIAAATAPIFAEHVMARLTGEHDPERALRALRQRHAGLLCVTLGARGAMLLDGDTLHAQRAFAVAVADSTSAGDVFRAGFLHGLLHQWAPRDTLRFACAAAAAACTRSGAIASVPSLADVEAVLRQSSHS